MKIKKGNLRVSVGSDVINDQMTVELQVDGIIFLLGVVKNEKTVSFEVEDKLYEFPFDDVQTALLEFVNCISIRQESSRAD